MTVKGLNMTCLVEETTTILIVSGILKDPLHNQHYREPEYRNLPSQLAFRCVCCGGGKCTV